MDPSILPTFAFISGTGLGVVLTWRMMEPLLRSAMASAAEKQVQLDQIHANHVRAGKTSHAAYRAHVLAKCAEISTSLPPLTPSTADRDIGTIRSAEATSAGAGQGNALAGANDRDVATNLERN